MRLFIAISFPQSLRQRMVEATDPLREQGFPVRWIDPDQLHLTLKFLGDVKRNRLEDVTAVMDEVGSDFRPFEVGFERVGAFPSLRSPRVIWLGVEATMEMRAVKHDLEHGLVDMGFERETRAFQPHVTLARADQDADAGDFRKLESLSREVEMDETHRVAQIDLVQSHLRSSGAEYERIHGSRLTAE